MASSIGGMAVFDQNQTLVYTNPSFLALFQPLAENEVLGKNVHDLVRKWDNIEGVVEEILGTLAEGGAWSGEICLPEKESGTERYLRVSANHVTDPSGAYVCTVASVVDVTEQKTMENAFKRTYGKLQETIEFVPDPTFIVNL